MRWFFLLLITWFLLVGPVGAEEVAPSLFEGPKVITSVPPEDIAREVNSFRASPLSFLEGLGLGEEEVRALWPDPLEETLSGNLYPLREEPLLEELARKRALGWLSGENQALDQEARELGYQPLVVDEVYLMLAFETPPPPEEAKEILLSTLFSLALFYDSEAVALLFPCYTELGAAFVSGQVEIEGEPYNAYLLELVFAVPLGFKASMFVGHAYEAGEGLVPLPGLRVSLEGLYFPYQAETITFAHGAFCLTSYPEGWYRVSVEAEGGPVSVPKFLSQDEAQELDFFLPPPTPAD